MKLLTLTLHDIRLHAYHGCLAQERSIGNDYCINLKVITQANDDALIHDQLSGTINYALLHRTIEEEMQQPSHLLEHVCARINRRLLHEWPSIQQVECEITKLAPPFPGTCAAASVKLTQTRDTP